MKSAGFCPRNCPTHPGTKLVVRVSCPACVGSKGGKKQSAAKRDAAFKRWEAKRAAQRATPSQ